MEAAATTRMMGSSAAGIRLQTTALYSQRISASTPCMSGSRDLAQSRRFRLHCKLRPLASAGTWRANATSPAAAAAVVHFTDRFDSTQQEQWQTSRHLVEELGFSSSEADDILAKSFGWSYSDYWGEEKQATVPNPEAVSASLSLMKSLGVDMAALVNKFPEVMGLTEREIQYSLGTLDGTWGISGKNLKSVLTRNPQVLGYNIDCGGDCAGECTRCWVRF